MWSQDTCNFRTHIQPQELVIWNPFPQVTAIKLGHQLCGQAPFLGNFCFYRQSMPAGGSLEKFPQASKVPRGAQ